MHTWTYKLEIFREDDTSGPHSITAWEWWDTGRKGRGKERKGSEATSLPQTKILTTPLNQAIRHGILNITNLPKKFGEYTHSRHGVLTNQSPKTFHLQKKTEMTRRFKGPLACVSSDCWRAHSEEALSFKKFMDPDPNPDYHQNLISSLAHVPSTTEFCGYRLSNFCVILLTNKLTDADENITSLGEGNQYTVRAYMQLRVATSRCNIRRLWR